MIDSSHKEGPLRGLFFADKKYFELGAVRIYGKELISGHQKLEIKDSND